MLRTYLLLLCLCVALGTAQTLSPKLAQWGHTATLLNDGRVLLAGGVCEQGVRNCRNEAQLYDPVTKEFSLIGPMLAARWKHAATLLPDGRVLLTGGGAKPGEPNAEIFDPATNTFVAAAEMNRTRRSHTSTLLPSGRVFVAGSSPEIYDPASNTFSPALASRPIPGLVNGLRLPQGQLYLHGSINTQAIWAESDQPVNPVFSAQYSEAPEDLIIDSQDHLRAGTFLQSLTLLLDGRVLIAGGCTDPYGFFATSDLDLYDPSTKTTRRLGKLPEGSHSHAATLLPDGSVILTGGWNEGSFNRTLVFDPRTEKLTEGPPMELPRSYHTATLLTDGTVLIAGGIIGRASAEIYRPANSIPSPLIAARPLGDFLEIYVAGLIPNSAIPPLVTVGGRLAEITYLGATQINVRIPPGIDRRSPLPVQLNYLDRPSNVALVSAP